jgi:hypothetical protein
MRTVLSEPYRCARPYFVVNHARGGVVKDQGKPQSSDDQDIIVIYIFPRKQSYPGLVKII